MARSVAPLLDDWFSHLPGVGLGSMADLLGDIYTFFDRFQIWNQLGHVFTLFGWAQVTSLLGNLKQLRKQGKLD